MTGVRDLALKASGLLYNEFPLDQILAMSKFILLKRLLVKNEISLILDVGANVGNFGKAMRQIGYKGRIISFEPVSTQFEKLKITASGDPQWRVHNYALGNESGAAVINVTQDSVFSSLRSPQNSDTSQFSKGNKILYSETIEVMRLDRFMQENSLQEMLNRTFVKTDTQGFDLNVLLGAGNDLASLCMLQVEISTVQLYESAPLMDQMLAFLTARNFQPAGLFPVNRLQNLSAVEFDYVGVNRASGHS